MIQQSNLVLTQNPKPKGLLPNQRTQKTPKSQKGPPFLKALKKVLFPAVLAAILLLAASLLPRSSQAGVFNLTHFLPSGDFGLGAEPEFNFGPTPGVGANFKYTQGLTDMNNLTVILGSGTGSRQFRAGGNFTFDFFPDIDSQPGIGVAVQGLYIQYATAPGVEITGIPYIHKAFSTSSGVIEPYIAFPIGIALSNGAYNLLFTGAVGTMVQHSKHFSTVYEVGIGISGVYSYLSAGLVYYN